MNTNSTGAKKQPKPRLVADTGSYLGERGSLRDLLAAFERMDDRASRQMVRQAICAAETFPRAACGALRQIAGGQA